MSKDDLVALLSKTELFGKLASDELEACALSFREAHFSKGETIFVRGDPGTRLYLVADPRVGFAGGGEPL